MKNKNQEPPLKFRERATMLAALRYWLREGWRTDEKAEAGLASYGGTIEPLTFEETEALCDRIAAARKS